MDADEEEMGRGMWRWVLEMDVLRMRREARR
jgi:hypothetical protein